MVRTVALALSAVCTACGGTVPAYAAERPGRLDTALASFQATKIEGLDVGRDGRIVAAGRSSGYPFNHPWVRAYLPNGSPDPAFGQNGTVQLEDDRRVVVGVVAQPDGRVLVAQGGDPYDYPAPAPHLVRRLTREGRPDTRFGVTGSIQPNFGATGTTLTDIALQPDGRIVVVGTRPETTVSPVVIVVARYMPDGSPDSGFGSNGATELPPGAPPLHAAVALQPDGGLILTASQGGVPVIARLTPDGRLDESFGGGVLAPLRYGRPAWADDVYALFRLAPPIVLQGGRIRVPVAFNGPHGRGYRMGLVGLTKDGDPDGAFGVLGRALGPSPIPRDGGESVGTAVGDSRGGVLVAGGYWNGVDIAFDLYPVIRRFGADGNVDRSFGAGGVVRGLPPQTGYPAFQQQLAFLDRDTLVVAQTEFDGKYGFWGPASIRTLHAGFDDDPPRISARVRGCRSLRVRITDLSGLDEVVVRAGRRVLRRTQRRRFRLRVPSRIRRVAVRATDLAENVSTRRVRLPRC